MEEGFLTGVFLQKTLKLAPLVLDRLLHEVRPDAGQGEVRHVYLHQIQHGEYSPRKGGGAGDINGESNVVRFQVRYEWNDVSLRANLSFALIGSQVRSSATLASHQNFADLGAAMVWNVITQSKNKTGPRPLREHAGPIIVAGLT